MKTYLSLLLVFSGLITSTKLNATDYYTLTNGDFTNTTTVWSTDGVTPCGCAPTCVSDGTHNIYINHDINLNCNLDVRNNSLISISSSGSLTG
ncbi:MAG: hypothetical protein ACLGGV_05140 [Bacteroidia bacterium]